MDTLKLTKKDFKDTNNYWKEYVGKEDLSDYDGHLEIEGNLGYVRFNSLKVSGYIIAEAGSGIKAGWGIEAGDGIEAGWGIEAGLSITCKLTLKFAYRIFAGICYWKEEISDEDKTITCGKLEGGEVAYGILNEIGLPNEKTKGKTVKIKLSNDQIVEGIICE